MSNGQLNPHVTPGAPARVFNNLVGLLGKLGLSLWGTRVLYVRGRKSGTWRDVPVNLLHLDGARYLVAPRGEVQWVHNMRAAGGGQLRLGRKVEAFTVTEIADVDKPPVLRGYLRRWQWEVGEYFDGVTADLSDDQLLEVAPRYPVFVINQD